MRLFLWFSNSVPDVKKKKMERFKNKTRYTDESISQLVKGNFCSFNFVVFFFAEWQKCFEGHKNPEVVIYPLLLLLLARKDSHKVTYLLQLTRSYFTPRLLLGNWWTLKPTVDEEAELQRKWPRESKGWYPNKVWKHYDQHCVDTRYIHIGWWTGAINIYNVAIGFVAASTSSGGTVFENHRKSLIQHCERSELRLHFERTKVN